MAILNCSGPDISKELHKIRIGNVPIYCNILREIIPERQEIFFFGSVTYSENSFGIHCHHFDHYGAIFAT